MLLCLAYKVRTRIDFSILKFHFINFISQMFGISSFLEAARLCSDAIWREGLLTKGPGLCHGISGNA